VYLASWLRVSKPTQLTASLLNQEPVPVKDTGLPQPLGAAAAPSVVCGLPNAASRSGAARIGRAVCCKSVPASTPAGAERNDLAVGDRGAAELQLDDLVHLLRPGDRAH
jgi:hypothetical protein